MPSQILNQIFLAFDLKTAVFMCQKATELTESFRSEKYMSGEKIGLLRVNLITNRLVFRWGRRYENIQFYQVDINLRPHEGGTLVYFVDTSKGIDYTNNATDEFIQQFIEAIGNLPKYN